MLPSRMLLDMRLHWPVPAWVRSTSSKLVWGTIGLVMVHLLLVRVDHVLLVLATFDQARLHVR